MTCFRRTSTVVRASIGIVRSEHALRCRQIAYVVRARVVIAALIGRGTARNTVDLVRPEIRCSTATIDRASRTRARLVVVIDGQTCDDKATGFERRHRSATIDVQISCRRSSKRHGHSRQTRRIPTGRDSPLRECLIRRESPDTHCGGQWTIQQVGVRCGCSPTRRWSRIHIANGIMFPGSSRPRVVEDVVEDIDRRRNGRSSRIVTSQESVAW